MIKIINFELNHHICSKRPEFDTNYKIGAKKYELKSFSY